MLFSSLNQKILCYICAVLLLAGLPARTDTLWRVEAEQLQAIGPSTADVKGTDWVQPVMQADLDQDGRDECLSLQDGSAFINDCQGQIFWQSPSGWQVREAQISDLNHDGQPEVTLLVWRPFQPWPIDRDDPGGGRIKDFHDRENESCHVILIHWARGGYNELWAGSALIRPVSQLRIADVDGDGGQELVALEGYYDSPFAGGALSVWRWRGFGFVLVDKIENGFRFLELKQNGQSIQIVTD